MGILDFNPAELESFLYVFVRVGVIVLFAPILGSGVIPVKLRIGLILLISFLVFPSVKSLAMPQPRGGFELALYMISEATIGLAIAYAARLVFAAVQLGGTMIDFQMGFGVVNVIDPQTASQVSITAQFQNILAIFIFLATDVHHLIIQTIVDSFHTIDPAKFAFSSATMEIVVQLFAAAFVTGIKLAAPVMAILFFISVGLGLVARTVPQMNVFILGFPLQIAAGLIMVGLSMSFFSVMLQDYFTELSVSFRGLLQSM